MSCAKAKKNKKRYVRVTVDPLTDDHCTVAVEHGCTVAEVLRKLAEQGVDIVNKTIASDLDIEQPVSCYK